MLSVFFSQLLGNQLEWRFMLGIYQQHKLHPRSFPAFLLFMKHHSRKPTSPMSIRSTEPSSPIATSCSPAQLLELPDLES